jgi:transposase
MKIAKDSLNKIGFCIRKLGKMNTMPKINDFKKTINRASVIKYDKRKDKFILYAKTTVIKEKQTNKNKIIRIDPGMRTMLTCLTNDKILYIGNNKITEKIKKECELMDKIKSKKKVNNRRRHLEKHEARIENYIKDIHWKISDYLSKNFDNVIFGNMSTKSIVERNEISDMGKRIISNMRFYKFKQRLTYKLYLRGKKFLLGDEYAAQRRGTSKQCSICYNIKEDLGSSKI